VTDAVDGNDRVNELDNIRQAYMSIFCVFLIGGRILLYDFLDWMYSCNGQLASCTVPFLK